MKYIPAIIENGTANCRDCYRCIRSCPVKAIKVVDGRTFVDDDRCIRCGACVKACQQGSKVIDTDIEEVKAAMAEGKTIFASVDSSYSAAFIEKRTDKVPDALRKLGFKYVEETADAGELIRAEVQKMEFHTGILHNCPAATNYIEKYMPEMAEKCLPITSANIIHARMIKQVMGDDCLVCSIVPCAARLSEARRPENAGLIDFCITFRDLLMWMLTEDIQVNDCEDSEFDYICLTKERTKGAGLVPVEGGMLHCAGYQESSLKNDFARHMTGPIDSVLKSIRDEDIPGIFELSLCEGGCISGCGLPYKNESRFRRWKSVMKHAVERKALPTVEPQHPELSEMDISMKFDPRPVELKTPSDEEIAEVLKKIGSKSGGKLYNCGSCGYATCREKAIAVLQGMAEIEMCMPYMRAMSKQRMDKITETLPCGVVILDHDLRIVYMNPTFKSLFFCDNNILGRHISYLISAESYEKVMDGESLCESIRTKYGVKYKESVYSLTEERQYVGIYMDISDVKMDNAKFSILQRQILDRMREMRQREVDLALELSQLIGVKTAENERILSHFIDILEQNSNTENRE